MGRLLVLAAERNVDLQYVLQFLLVPVPLSIASPDEVMAKTNKSALFDVLETKVKNHGLPNSVSAYIIDGQFLLHSLPSNLPPSYGGLARTVLEHCVKSVSKSIHLIFDDYPQPSIKGQERDRRGIDERTFVITGPEQRRVPRDLNDALRSRSFKKQLPAFLAVEWVNPSYAETFADKEIILDVPGECYSFVADNGVVHRRTVDGLQNNHEEADTKVCLHAYFVENTRPQGDIVVRATDTDIAVILLYHCHSFTSRLWMEVGMSAKNNRRFINLTAIAKEIGPGLCSALPAFHAFTGSDLHILFCEKRKGSTVQNHGKPNSIPGCFCTNG